MALIEGLGDEVTFLIGVFVTMTLALLIWFSVSIGEQTFLQNTFAAVRTNIQASLGHGQARDESPQTNRGSGPPPHEPNSHEVQDLTNESQPSSAAASQEEAQDQEEEEPVENIEVRIKFLNDTERVVNAQSKQKLGEFKRNNFSEDLDANKIVRLIFNGHLLKNDAETLHKLGFYDKCFVHCQISSTPTNGNAGGPTVNNNRPANRHSEHTAEVELDLSRFMLPLFGVILGLLWWSQIQFQQYFNGASTFGLVCITGMFVLALVRPVR